MHFYFNKFFVFPALVKVISAFHVKGLQTAKKSKFYVHICIKIMYNFTDL